MSLVLPIWNIRIFGNFGKIPDNTNEDGLTCRIIHQMYFFFYHLVENIYYGKTLADFDHG